MIKASLRALTAIEKVTSAIAAFFMFAIMIIVFADVVMRYAFNRPTLRRPSAVQTRVIDACPAPLIQHTPS